jgi:hypothetical protein
MTTEQDTSADASGAQPRSARAARQVFVVGQDGSFPPAALAAETIFLCWQALPASAPPALVVADCSGYPALVDHLRKRILQAPAAPTSAAAELHQLVNGALDEGATLIAGGLPTEDGGWQATLFVHATANSRLCDPQAPIGPILAVLPSSADRPADQILAALRGPLAFLRLGADGQLDSSPTTEAAS